MEPHRQANGVAEDAHERCGEGPPGIDADGGSSPLLLLAAADELCDDVCAPEAQGSGGEVVDEGQQDPLVKEGHERDRRRRGHQSVGEHGARDQDKLPRDPRGEGALRPGNHGLDTYGSDVDRGQKRARARVEGGGHPRMRIPGSDPPIPHLRAGGGGRRRKSRAGRYGEGVRDRGDQSQGPECRCGPQGVHRWLRRVLRSRGLSRRVEQLGVSFRIAVEA
mmetsp:Transcript_8002/g.20592  ORF Transcript_8002/g.20592 Transcript_8002/m.20592 type:complete len:221 (+) Transcript_8002:341-1003(+)